MKNKLETKPTAEFPYKRGEQKVSNYGAEIVRWQFGAASVFLRLTQRGNSKNQGVQKVDRNRTKNLRQLCVKTAPIRVHRRFTESSPGFKAFSLGRCQKSDQKTSLVFGPSFVLFSHVASDIWKSPIQFDIPSSYLYVVVLQRPAL